VATNKVEIEITAKSTGFAAEFDKITSKVQASAGKIGSALSSVQSAVAALGVSLTIGGFALFIKGAIDAADKLNDLSKATGVSAVTLGGIGFAAQQAGGDLEGAAKAFGKLNLYIAQALGGNQDAVDTFKKLGISVAELRNNKPDEILAKVADAFAGFDDDANKAAGASLLFGKSWQSIVPLLDEGGQSLRANVEYFKQYSGLTDDLVHKSDQFNDSMTKLNLLNKAFGNYLAAALLPSLQDFVNFLVEGKEKSSLFADAASGTADVMKTLAQFAVIGGTAFVEFGTAIGGVAAALAAVGTGRFTDAKNIIAEIGASIEKTEARVKGLLKAIDSPGLGAFVGPPDLRGGSGKRPTPSFGGAGLSAGKDKADEFAKALQNVAKSAAEAQLELEAAFSGKELTGAQKALAALTSSDAWKSFTSAQRRDLTQQYEAIDAIQRETSAWKKNQDQLEKNVKVMADIEAEQKKAVDGFRERLGQYQDENDFLKRTIDLVGDSDLAHQKLAETIKYEAAKKEAMLALDVEGLAQLKKDFAERISLIEQLQAATERFATIQQYNSVFVNSFADGLTSIVTGTKSVKEAFKDMEKSIVESISRIAAQNLAEALFGGKNGIGSIFQGLFGSSGQSGSLDWSKLFQSIFGSLFGGSSGGAGFGQGINGYATGTRFAPGGMALVGERGPELINLPRGSQVIPNDVLRRKGNVTNIFHVNVLPGTNTASIRQTGDMLREAVSRSARSR
jgi:hypothetical protein